MAVNVRCKRIIGLVIILLVLIISILQFTGILQNTVARLSTTVYVSVKYPSRNFQFQYVEYVPQFGDYFVSYKDKNNTQVSFTVTPKFFPIFVTTDPLNPPLLELTYLRFTIL